LIHTRENHVTTTIAITAPGNMGAAVGARLGRHGARVVTSLAGRSAASAARTEAAGMDAVSDQALVEVDVILSILPPNEALPMATRLSQVLQGASKKPLYIDCNAVSPDTAQAIGQVIQATGTDFLDASIIGGPPKAQGDGPTFYVCGPAANRALELERFGLVVKMLGGPIGAASALKMSYGGITKGLVALASAMSLAADRFGVGGEFRAELAASQPQLSAWLDPKVPDMFPKAYRWVAEMNEISAFVGARPEADAFSGIAGVYEDFARDWAGARQDTDTLAALFNAAGQHRTAKGGVDCPGRSFGSLEQPVVKP
jgi:3-hydroxyisobutyrate dehydrogenase-like beta-hydroxyacid dehydrogenase